MIRSAEQIWRLDSPDNDRVRAKEHLSTEYEIIICPIDPGHQRGGRRLSQLAIVLPSRVNDVVFSWLSDCMLQKHVVDIFKKNEITGFETRPVTVYPKRSGKSSMPEVPVHTPELYELIVTGWGGVAPPESGIHRITLPPCPGCKQEDLLRYTSCTNLSALFDVKQWDGSDIFMIWPLPRFIFITDRVAKLIRAHEITGVELTPIEELDLGDSGFGPGPLSYYMPERRAKEIGEPLGIY